MTTVMQAHCAPHERKDWQKFAIGYPEKGLMGRSTTALYEAAKRIRKGEEVIFRIGAGGPFIKDGVPGESTAERTLYVLKKRWAEFPFLNEYRAEIEQLLENAVLDPTARTSEHEIEIAVNFCIENDCENLFFVTDRSHAQRSMQLCGDVRAEMNLHASELSVAVFAADIEHGKTLVIEPPMLGDDVRNRMPKEIQPHNLLRVLFKHFGSEDKLRKIMEGIQKVLREAG